MADSDVGLAGDQSSVDNAAAPAAGGSLSGMPPPLITGTSDGNSATAHVSVEPGPVSLQFVQLLKALAKTNELLPRRQQLLAGTRRESSAPEAVAPHVSSRQAAATERTAPQQEQTLVHQEVQCNNLHQPQAAWPHQQQQLQETLVARYQRTGRHLWAHLIAADTRPPSNSKCDTKVQCDQAAAQAVTVAASTAAATSAWQWQQPARGVATAGLPGSTSSCCSGLSSGYSLQRSSSSAIGQSLLQLPETSRDAVPKVTTGHTSSQLQSAVSAGSSRRSRFKGLTWDRQAKTWRVRIQYQGKQHHIGRFSEDVKAAKAFDRAAYFLWGRHAVTNFGITAAAVDREPVAPVINQLRKQAEHVAAAADMEDGSCMGVAAGVAQATTWQRQSNERLPYQSRQLSRAPPGPGNVHSAGLQQGPLQLAPPECDVVMSHQRQQQHDHQQQQTALAVADGIPAGSCAAGIAAEVATGSVCLSAARGIRLSGQKDGLISEVQAIAGGPTSGDVKAVAGLQAVAPTTAGGGSDSGTAELQQQQQQQFQEALRHALQLAHLPVSGAAAEAHSHQPLFNSTGGNSCTESGGGLQAELALVIEEGLLHQLALLHQQQVLAHQNNSRAHSARRQKLRLYQQLQQHTEARLLAEEQQLLLAAGSRNDGNARRNGQPVAADVIGPVFFKPTIMLTEQASANPCLVGKKRSSPDTSGVSDEDALGALPGNAQTAALDGRCRLANAAAGRQLTFTQLLTALLQDKVQGATAPAASSRQPAVGTPGVQSSHLLQYLHLLQRQEPEDNQHSLLQPSMEQQLPAVFQPLATESREFERLAAAAAAAAAALAAANAAVVHEVDSGGANQRGAALSAAAVLACMKTHLITQKT